MKRDVLYPTTVINYVIDDIARLSSNRMKDSKEVAAYYGSQITSHPHLGTIVSAMCAFSVAKHISDYYDKSPRVNFTYLENEGGVVKVVDDIKYQRMLCDDPKGKEEFNAYLDSFKQLFSQLSELSDVPVTIDSYSDLQAKPLARKTLLDIIDKKDSVLHLLTPMRDKVGIRFKCPECSYLDKHYKTLKMLEYLPGKMARFDSRCFEHGNHEHTLDVNNNNEFVDVNGMVRNVMKEVVISSESEEIGSYPIIIKGADWIPTAIMVSEALEELGYSYDKRPQRIYTPLVLDWSGAKLSKSEPDIGKNETSSLLSYPEFIKDYGISGLNTLWNEVFSWTADTKKFYRHYTISFFADLFGIGGNK